VSDGKLLGEVTALKLHEEATARTIGGRRTRRTTREVPEPGQSMGDVFPNLIPQWDTSNRLSTFDYRPRSNREVIWRCEKGHRWSASIANRAAGNGCPGCRGFLRYLLPDDPARVQAEQEQAAAKPKTARAAHAKPEEGGSFGDHYPDLVATWDAENPLTPFDYRPKSSVVVIWQCAAGHRWRAAISNRANGSGCPGCRGKRKFLLPPAQA
jgi:hypothetical protein